jgi:hypothetical protein
MMASVPGNIWQPVVSVSGFSPPLKNSSILMTGCLAGVVFDDILLLCLKNQEEALSLTEKFLYLPQRMCRRRDQKGRE